MDESQSFFNVLDKPREPILQAFVSLSRASSDGPLSIFDFLHFEMIQNLDRLSLTSLGCSACTRSCLFAKISRGTPDSYFSFIIAKLQSRASQAQPLPISLSWYLLSRSHTPVHPYS